MLRSLNIQHHGSWEAQRETLRVEESGVLFPHLHFYLETVIKRPSQDEVSRSAHQKLIPLPLSHRSNGSILVGDLQDHREEERVGGVKSEWWKSDR